MIKIKHSPGGVNFDSVSTEEEDGLSIKQIIERHHGTSDVKAWVHGSNEFEWEEIPAEILPFTKPKAGTELLLTYNPNGGGKSGALFASLAIIALSIAAGPIGTFIATSLALSASYGAFIGGVILFGGSILINALFSQNQKQKALDLPAEAQTGDQTDMDSDTNALGRGQYLAVAFGEIRLLPPDIVNPHFYISDGLQKLDRVFALYGEHEFWNVEVDGTKIDDLDGIEIQTFSGEEADGTYSFIDRYTSSVRPNQELQTFLLLNAALTEQSASRRELCTPKPFRFTTIGNSKLSKIDIILGITSLYDVSSTSVSVTLPVRLRVKKKGEADSTFINFPEMHFTGNFQNSKNLSIQIDWSSQQIPQTARDLFINFWQKVPASAFSLSDGSSGIQWLAHSNFQDGTSGLRVSKNTNYSGDGVVLSMDDSVLNRNSNLEWEIIRGGVVRTLDLSDAYVKSGSVISLFKGMNFSGTWSFYDQVNFPVRCSVVSATNVVADRPVKNSKIAQIAVRATQRGVKKFSTMASWAALDWNGSSWSNKEFRNKNPAVIYWNIIMKSLQQYNIDTDILTRNNDIFVAWRQECEDRGYECNGVAQGESLGEILSSVAQAGFADPVFSSSISISYFHDTSSEPFRQRFNERDVSDIEITKVSSEKPLGYKVRFNNEALNFLPDELEVSSDNSATFSQYETVSYKMITKGSLAFQRAYFDLLQLKNRDSLITFNCGLSGIISEPGDIVLFTSQIFSETSIGFQVNQVIDNVHVAVDVEIDGSNVPASINDDPEIEEMLLSGEKSIVFFQFPTCVDSYTVVNVSGNVWRLNKPLLSMDIEGTRGTLTKSSEVNKRCLVLSVDRQDNKTAKVTLVEEHPEIYAEMREMFQ